MGHATTVVHVFFTISLQAFQNLLFNILLVIHASRYFAEQKCDIK